MLKTTAVVLSRGMHSRAIRTTLGMEEKKTKYLQKFLRKDREIVLKLNACIKTSNSIEHTSKSSQMKSKNEANQNKLRW